MASEAILFSNQNIELAGTLYKPETAAPYPAVVVVHPASEGERSSPFYEHLGSQLPPAGLAVLVFDRRGSGASAGDFETADFEDLAGDVMAAVEYLQSRPDIDQRRIGLHGTSQGAWVAPIAAARKPDIAVVVVVSASGVSPADQMNYGVAVHLAKAGFDQGVVENAIALRNLVNTYFRGQVSREDVAAELRRYEDEPWFEAAYLYSSTQLPADTTKSKWHYELDYEPLSIWKQVKQPALLLFAEVDDWVPIEQSMANYHNATGHLSDVALIRLNGTDHLMRNQAGEIAPAYLEVLLDWLTFRLTPPQSP